jgi:hypothetical protein
MHVDAGDAHALEFCGAAIDVAGAAARRSELEIRRLK